ncbi:MAG: type II toxin-antitoxin system VapC family toxin [Actinomycetota bacterium]
MSRGLLDTSIFIAFETGRLVNSNLLPDELAVSVVTIGELQVGILTAKDAAAKSKRLKTYRGALRFNPVDIDQQIAEDWATLRVTLRESGRSVSVNDLWIAATALALGVPLVTQDQGLVGLPNIETILV